MPTYVRITYAASTLTWGGRLTTVMRYSITSDNFILGTDLTGTYKSMIRGDNVAAVQLCHLLLSSHGQCQACF